MPRRQAEKVSHDNKERWLLTYSDLITLLMIFFVVMYSISTINAQKMAALASSLAQAFIGSPAPGLFDAGGLPSLVPGVAPAPGGQGTEGQSTEGAELARIKVELQQYIQQEGLQDQVTLKNEERGLVVSMADTILFPKGSAELTPAAHALLQRVGQALAKLPNYLRVEGHTDNLPIHTPLFPSNWELSTARATNVVKVLVNDAGINPERLSATGYGEYRPVVPNDTEANMARNRRVDIVVLKEAYNVTEPHH
ncbi:OmpA/MotB family protein [Moorella sp. ACPs]|uniref:OmpA/MotB family protein n=1 Tax=Neomoorella carbonis TaxID=3062783 RepID=UPI00324555DF